MNLCQISIENFRKFKDQVTIPISKSQLILGTNNSGKTTIIKAIDCALNKKPIDKKDLYNPNQCAKFSLNFFDKENEEVYTLMYESKGLPSNTNHNWKGKSPKITPSNIFVESNSFDAEKIAQDIALENNDQLKKQMEEFRLYLKSEIDDLLNGCDKEDLLIGELPHFESDPEIKIKTKFLGKLIDNKQESIPFEQNGEGYKKSLNIALLKRLKNSATLILIDEIENHISIPNVKQIISRLVKKNNIIFTSHRLEAEVKDIKGITFLGNDENDILGAIDSLELEVHKYNKIILVEGKNDIFYINKFLELKKSEETAIVVYVNGESNMKTIYYELKKRMKNKNNSKIFPIKDGDMREKDEHVIEYLKKNTIEDYHDYQDKIKEKYGEVLYKSVCSQFLDFFTKDHDLYKELDSIIFSEELDK